MRSKEGRLVGEEESAGLDVDDGDWAGRGISLRIEMSGHYKNGIAIFS
jgi:hypothetical protein